MPTTLCIANQYLSLHDSAASKEDESAALEWLSSELRRQESFTRFRELLTCAEASNRSFLDLLETGVAVEERRLECLQKREELAPLRKFLVLVDVSSSSFVSLLEAGLAAEETRLEFLKTVTPAEAEESFSPPIGDRVAAFCAGRWISCIVLSELVKDSLRQVLTPDGLQVWREVRPIAQ